MSTGYPVAMHSCMQEISAQKSLQIYKRTIIVEKINNETY